MIEAWWAAGNGAPKPQSPTLLASMQFISISVEAFMLASTMQVIAETNHHTLPASAKVQAGHTIAAAPICEADVCSVICSRWS